MNLESAASSASSSSPSQSRQTRGAIAVQACETCRGRKQKCDEKRPKCGLCQRMNLPCVYKETQPTKKDKTMQEILQRVTDTQAEVKSLSSKWDSKFELARGNTGFGPPQPSPNSQPSLTTETDETPSYSPSSYRQSQPATSNSKSQAHGRHTPAAHKILTWPMIQDMLLHYLPASLNILKTAESDGTALVVRVSKSFPDLAIDEGLQEEPFLGMQSQSSRNTGGPRVTFPSLSNDEMLRLATLYFDSFNLLYPFMDRQNFLSDTLGRVSSEGFNGDTDSVIALLIFALGEMASEGVQGKPSRTVNGRPSGVRGGDGVQRPPGLAYFNEAMKRIGFVMNGYELENVQVFCLTALYYESCFRHRDFWRYSGFASSACYVLVTCNNIDWESPRGDLIMRAYWHCAIMETGLNLELDLPLTPIVNLESKVGMPSFNSTEYNEEDQRGNDYSYFEQHWAAQVALRRLCADLHHAINDCMNDNDRKYNEFVIPPDEILQKYKSRLAEWHAMNPQVLKWPEADPSATTARRSVGTPAYGSPLDPSLSTSGSYPSLVFSTDLDREPIKYKYVYDIQVALLRTRYYYAKYIVHRPYIYKALHYGNEMSRSDAQGAAECLQACLNWPLTFSPISRQKRLVPYLFCWSQNFLGILLIFHLAEHNPVLKQIRFNYCGPEFEAGYRQSITLMLNWIRDLRDYDPIAQWCWEIIENIGHIGPVQ